MTVYLCPESPEGILCGVYDAWMSRRGHANVRLALAEHGNMELFCEYRDVVVEEEKLSKVITAIQSKISEEAYKHVLKAASGMDEERADKIYRFLIYGFHYGGRVMDMLQLPAVYDIFEICRYVDNETHLLLEFVRFSEMEGKILVSRIGPKNDVLVLLAPHFADRLSGENWLIYDEKRKKAVLHPANKSWMVVYPDSEEWRDRLKKIEAEDEYKSLWKMFRKRIAIAERRNPVCQRNHMPLRYRPYMSEFEDRIID